MEQWDTSPLRDPVEEGLRIVRASRGGEQDVYLLGGIAVKLRATQMGRLLLEREFGDIDVVVSRSAGRRITRLLSDLGYLPMHEFNSVNGRTRMLFRDERHERDLDVLVGVFEMCHALPVLENANTQEPTIPLADLLMTKLQIVELTSKDVIDVFNLLYAHEVGDSTPAANTIDGSRIAQLCSKEWGLWRTVTRNLGRILEPPFRPHVDDDATQVVGARAEFLLAEIAGARKSTRWQLRSRVGDRVRWYEEPEEAH